MVRYRELNLAVRYKIIAALALLALAAPAWAQWETPAVGQLPTSAKEPDILKKVGIEQRLNQQLPLDLVFHDEAGRAVLLGNYFGRKPVILALVYYECPMLCTQVLNGLVSALGEAMKGRAGSLSPYEMSTTDFNITFITPVHVYAAKDQAPRPVMDFGNWSRYVESLPPVLLVRVRPKLGEGFWTKVGRGAARTQGMAIPPIKRFQSSFLRLRAFCGSAEVTPIHPFKIAQRISETNTIYEGLYVFDPGALGAQCGTVKLELYSEKEPTKADTHVLEPAIIRQIRRDFEVVRSAGSSPAK